MTLLTPTSDGGRELTVNGSDEEARMRIEVDADRCEGFGMCEQTAPNIVRSPEGLAEPLIDPVPDELTDLARKAVRACPRGALRLR